MRSRIGPYKDGKDINWGKLRRSMTIGKAFARYADDYIIMSLMIETTRLMAGMTIILFSSYHVIKLCH